MAEYKLGNFEFNTEEELAAAKKELLLIKTVKEKYNVDDVKVARVVISKFAPKTIIGERFVIQLYDRCAEEDNKSILEAIDNGIKEKKREEKVKTEAAQKTVKKTASMPRRQFPLPNYDEVEPASKSNNQVKPVNRSRFISFIIILIVVNLLIAGLKRIVLNAISNKTVNPTSATKTTGQERVASHSYGDVVQSSDGYACYVIPSDCEGNNVLYDDGEVCLKNIKYKETKQINQYYNVYYTGTMEWKGDRELQSVTVYFALLDKNNVLCTESDAGFKTITNHTKEYVGGQVKPGDSIDFEFYIYTYQNGVYNASKLALTSMGKVPQIK